MGNRIESESIRNKSSELGMSDDEGTTCGWEGVIVRDT